MSIKKIIQDFLGITDVKDALERMDNDIVALMDKDLGQELQVIPADEPPECDPKSPYVYQLGRKGNPTEGAGYYVIWHVGFAGPFPSKKKAERYKSHHKLRSNQFCAIEWLTPHAFTEKK